MKKEIQIGEEIRRDGIAASFLIDSDMMSVLADSIPKARIYIGYPSICHSEKKRCQEILKKLKNSSVEILVASHAKMDSLIEAGNLIRGCKNAGVAFWVPSSKTFLKRTINIDQDKIIEYTEKLIKKFKKNFNSPIDLAITDATNKKEVSPEFLAEFCKRAHKAGARVIIISDTLGKSSPKEIKKIFSAIKKQNSGKIEFHAHNDNNLALKNIEAAVNTGVNIISTSFFNSSERKNMVDPRTLLEKGYSFKFYPNKFKLFYKLYSSKIGDPKKIMSLVYKKDILITGSQARLRGRPNKEYRFGVTSDRYILKRLTPELKDKDDNFIRKKMDELKNSLYKSNKIHYSREDILELDMVRGK